MVAIAIASFIVLAATSYYAAMFSAGNSVRNTASAQAHFNAVANTVVAEIRRSGYRGSPTEVAAYVAKLVIARHPNIRQLPRGRDRNRLRAGRRARLHLCLG